MKNNQKDPSLKMPSPAEAGGERTMSQLHILLVESLQEMYWAEKELIKSLPILSDAATTAGLKMAIEEHLFQTETQVKRLVQAFIFLGEQAQGKKCEAMAGLLKESATVLEQTLPGTMSRDAAIIMAAQKVEHYEIATYGTLVEFARTLGLKQVSGLLHATLDEEKMADQGLTVIAQTGINWEAEHEIASEKSSTI